MTRVRVLAEVAIDIAEAANWHDRKGYVGLGQRFEKAFYDPLPDCLKLHRYTLRSFLSSDELI